MSKRIMRRAIDNWQRLGGEFQWKQRGDFLSVVMGQTETYAETKARQDRLNQQLRDSWRDYWNGVMQ